MQYVFHLFTIVIFDNNAYISFALQFPQSRIVGTQNTLLNAFIHVRIAFVVIHITQYDLLALQVDPTLESIQESLAFSRDQTIGLLIQEE